LKKLVLILYLIILCGLCISPVVAQTTATISISGIVPEPKPTCSFTANPTSGTTPLTVQFTDTSSHVPTSWKWEYKGKSDHDWKQFSISKNPSYTFQKGIYDIRLTVKNDKGSDVKTKQNYIAANEPPKPKKPIAIFFVDPHLGKPPLEVKFTDGSLNSPITYRWKFDDGSTSSEKSPVHIYTQPGFYRVQLTVSNTIGNDTAERTVLVIPRWFWFDWRR
jgi:PKD repeat protein